MNNYEQLIFEEALKALRHDDANPDVGMGMFPVTAVDIGIDRLEHISGLLGLNISEDMYDRKKIEKALDKRPYGSRDLDQ